jgi:hypothetical protein
MTRCGNGYHEAYWVVIAFTSPVVALEAVVAGTQVTLTSRIRIVAERCPTYCLTCESGG